MVLGRIFERFVAESPVSVMTRATMQTALAASALDELFEATAERQYTRELLFSTLVDLISVVVLDAKMSVNAAYQAAVERIPVSLTAVYNKLDGLELAVAAALVAHTAARLAPVITAMGGQLPALVPGYRVKIVDGNHFAATERRLQPLRRSKAGPLPGFALVVLDPALMLAVDVVPCEDGHAQERSQTEALLARFAAGDLVIADRNFCTSRFLAGCAAQGVAVLIRQHATNLAWEPVGPRRQCARRDGVTIHEQAIIGRGPDGSPLALRRITIELATVTRGGAMEIDLVTSLPATAVPAVAIAALYRERWTVETMFHDLARTLNGEIKALAYPKAAIFCFCVALAAYNVLSTVKAALRGKYGHDRIEDEVSEYYLADEIRGMSRGMMIAIPPPAWRPFERLDAAALAAQLLDLAGRVRLARFRRHARGPKKATRRTRYTTHTHIATARLLAASRA
jgi:hypothetical protein